jgi:hypothetical protein
MLTAVACARLICCSAFISVIAAYARMTVISADLE